MPKQEIELAGRIKKGYPAACERMINANLQHAVCFGYRKAGNNKKVPDGAGSEDSLG
jgi:hypothetical protein